MDPYERTKLGDALNEKKFKKGDFIISEGEVGKSFYFISEGTAIATKKLDGNTEATKVKDYAKGQYFGERALLTNENRAANIVATSEEVIVLELERDTFTRLLGSLQDILSRNMSDYTKFAGNQWEIQILHSEKIFRI